MRSFVWRSSGYTAERTDSSFLYDHQAAWSIACQGTDCRNPGWGAVYGLAVPAERQTCNGSCRAVLLPEARTRSNAGGGKKHSSELPDNRDRHDHELKRVAPLYPASKRQRRTSADAGSGPDPVGQGSLADSGVLR